MAPTKSDSASATKRAPRILAGHAKPAVDSARAQALALYEAAVRLMQEGKFEKAHATFTSMLESNPGDLADRGRMYVNACQLQIAKGKTTFADPEEQYDYAISLLNDGLYDDARQQFEQILSTNPGADYAFYGLAVLASLTGAPNGCLEHLSEAIRLNPRNRIQARADSDFQDMADDPRFTELLYPEV